MGHWSDLGPSPEHECSNMWRPNRKRQRKGPGGVDQKHALGAAAATLFSHYSKANMRNTTLYVALFGLIAAILVYTATAAPKGFSQGHEAELPTGAATICPVRPHQKISKSFELNQHRNNQI